MPRPEEKPPNKRVDELVTEITNEMWSEFEIKEHPQIRDDKITTFLIRKIAEFRAFNEILEERLNEILEK
jgi:hypothetical protein